MNKKQLQDILKTTTPHYFGLGFIQCKINQYERIHVYHPSLTPIVNIEEEIHNHRYDFMSTVLLGKINNKKYEFLVSDNPTHFLQNESCNENIKPDIEEKQYGNIILTREEWVHTDESYFMSYNEFHTFQTDKCITYLRRSDYKQELAQFVRPIGSQVVCPFSKKLSSEECWNIIHDCLKEV